MQLAYTQPKNKELLRKEYSSKDSGELITLTGYYLLEEDLSLALQVGLLLELTFSETLNYPLQESTADTLFTSVLILMMQRMKKAAILSV